MRGLHEGQRVKCRGLQQQALLTRSTSATDRGYVLELTRLNGHPLAVNCDLIRYVEASPDTVLTLVTGEKLLVRETQLQVIQAAFAYRAALLRAAWPDAAGALTGVAAAGARQVSAERTS